jgi:hypothetical protein
MQTAGKDATVRRLMNENSTLMDENSILRAEIERLRASNKEQRGQTTLALDLVSTRNRDDLPPGFRTIDKLRDWLPIWREPSHCHALLHPIALGCGRLFESVIVRPFVCCGDAVGRLLRDVAVLIVSKR